MTFGGNNKGPSIAELQRYVREKVDLIFVLANNASILGKLRWFDENAFSVEQEGQQPFTILRSAVVGYRKASSAVLAAAKAQASATSTAQSSGDSSQQAPPAQQASSTTQQEGQN